MIRFLEKEVYCLEKSEAERGSLFCYFLEENRHSDIIVVYENGVFYGTITYKSLLHSCGDGIYTQKYMITHQSADLWNEIDDQLKLVPKGAYLPIFNQEMELLYFAYEDHPKEEISIFLRQLEAKKEYLFIKEIFPMVKLVVIHDLNEWAYRLCQILVMRGFPVKVIGDKWKVLFPEIFNAYASDEFQTVQSQVMNVYAEGADTIWEERCRIDKAWEFLLNIRMINMVSIREKMQAELSAKGAAAFWVSVPGFHELSFATVDEWYRCVNRIYPRAEERWLPAYQEQMVRVGAFKCAEEYTEECVRGKEWQLLKLENGQMEMKRFGNAPNTIYIIGPCIVRGVFTSDQDTIGNHIYQKISEMHKNYSVVCIFADELSLGAYEELIPMLMIRENDIFLLFDGNGPVAKGLHYHYPSGIDLKPLYDTRQEEWFYDIPLHINKIASEKIAEKIYNSLEQILEREINQVPDFLQVGRRKSLPEEEIYIKNYVSNIMGGGGTEGLRIGGIVMHCNPMTLGHLFLIERALEDVDFLYLFIVEEDRAEISFADRISLVKETLKDDKRVKVVSSGRYMISYETLPLYFEKAKKQNESLDAAADLQIFCEKIAPELGITIRFVGEEPFDRITRQYNETMKKLLPLYGIRLMEIPRLEKGGRAISASRVRWYLEEGCLEEVKECVPQCVYEYFIKKYNKKF